MFSILRYCKCGLYAGLIGMLAGMAGQIYIYELSDKNEALMQAAIVFKELDELAFLVAFVSAVVFLCFCLLVEYKWQNRKKLREGKLES